MKHHFGDLLDRTGRYWTIIPNRDRYTYSAADDIADKDNVKILTVSKHHREWKQVFECPNIEELTLHEPSLEQVAAIQQLPQLKRLRITFLRAKDIEFVASLPNLEELVLEYVSGFSDLTPLKKLRKLRAVHLENLRGVFNFDGIKGVKNIKYLHIDGTLDWNQPIENFDFLEGLPNLEVFSLGFIINKSVSPALASVLKLNALQKIKIGRATFKTNEYAFLEVALPKVEGSSWELCWEYNGNYEFLGKGAGRVRIVSPKAQVKCDEFINNYNSMKQEAREWIKNIVGNNK